MSPGTSENGLVIEETNQIDLVFTIRQYIEEADTHVPQADLWIFPDMSVAPANEVMELEFLVQTFIPAHSRRSSRWSYYYSGIMWNTNDSCINLDITYHSEKISNYLKRRKMNESSVRLEVEIVWVESSESAIQESTASRMRGEYCAAISQQKNSNDSFLIIKNYNETSVSFGLSSTPANGISKRAVLEQVVHDSPVRDDIACRVVPLVVNLATIYGNFIKAPTITDVKDCSGQCVLHLNRGRFTKHGETKERLKLLPGGETLSNFEPRCMPIRYRPLNVLIRLRDKSEVIVQMPDLVIDKCACQ